MKTLILFLVLLSSIITLKSQTDSLSFCFAFYNLENFFDPEDDSLKNDDAYTIKGLNRWNYSKMIHKRNQIAKVILSMNQWSPPDIVGVAEVETAKQMKDLCRFTGLKKYQYNYIHFESNDNRGIEVAFIYRMDRVNILESHAIPILFPFDTMAKNRDILYVKVQLYTKDTIHFFINHWTSRFGGFGATVKKRNFYAATLKAQIDTIFQKQPQAYIIVMGDFNDYPSDESMDLILQAKEEATKDAGLINLMRKYKSKENLGTHKNEEFWGCLDQILISRSFFNDSSKLSLNFNEDNIYKADFLLVNDEKYGGEKPFRTFDGVRYIGGFSDHLPIFIKIKKKE